MRILVTAFDPFGGEAENASQRVLAALPDRIGDAELVRRVVPTVFGLAAETAAAAVREMKPAAVVCLGQAAGRAAVTPERVAVNLMDASIPDNAGKMPAEEPVVPGGPAAYFSTLPVKDMAAAMVSAGVPAQVSNSAGLFVCNSLLYGLLHFIHTDGPQIPCGFIHVPLLEGQETGSRPALPPETAVRGVTA